MKHRCRTSFLNTQIKEVIYAELQNVMEECGVNIDVKVEKLNAALYGLKQSSREFGIMFEVTLTNKLVLIQSKVDTCIFKSLEIFLMVYVDGIIVCRDLREVIIIET